MSEESIKCGKVLHVQVSRLEWQMNVLKLKLIVYVLRPPGNKRVLITETYPCNYTANLFRITNGPPPIQ